MNISEYQIVVADDGTRLADIRRVDPKLADTFYLQEHPENQDGPCMCKECRSNGD